MIWGRIFSIIAGVLILSIISTVFPATASAATDWLNDELIATEEDIPTELDLDCKPQTVPIGGPLGLREEVCVYQADGWRYGTYRHMADGQWYDNLIVSFGDEQAMYVVSNLSPKYGLMYAGQSNHIIFYGDHADNMAETFIIKNFPSKIQKVGNEYLLKSNSIEPLLPDENGDPTPLRFAGVSVSMNGKWLAVMPEPAGLVRINLQNFEKRWFSKYKIDYSHPRVADGQPAWLVSNDGKYIGRSSQSISPTISKVTDECGKAITTFYTAWVANPNSVEINPCPERDVSAEISEVVDDDLTFSYMLQISSDANAIGGVAAHIEHNDAGVPITGYFRWFNLHNTTNSSQRLEYLALGDSYSSGEGDTEKDKQGKKYYRPFTNNEENKTANIPREKCHISTRSYPYKLALSMGLSQDNPEQWDTVACSGATAWDVKAHASAEYEGQNKGSAKPWYSDAYDERLKDYDATSLKAQALNEFIPGRHKQIEFVRKYKPKAITLTMGGNDVDFGGKLAKCILPFDQCRSATEKGRIDLGKEIQGQFNNLKSLYKELQQASSQTKIYILGYPQIINGTNNDASCSVNIGGFDAEERRVIYEGYAYMNNVIEAAARNTGVKYIEVEDALNGHKLCDGNRDVYATGLAVNGNSELQESFHPNVKGNQAIADRVQEQLTINGIQYSLLNYPYQQQADYSVVAPSPTPYLAGDMSTKKVITKRMVSKAIQKSVPSNIFIDILSLAVNSVIRLTLYSDPVDLGEFPVNSDGSLEVAITIPEHVPAGYHTLVLEGVTYSGEPVQYEQIIFVHGANLNDIDEDGINDSVDPCLFIIPAMQDEDMDGQDDACDPEIGEAPQDPYRVRAGDPAKTYAGQPEKAGNLYIERNKNATAITGISGDYDSDGDGWVVVATSQNTTGAAPYAKFWLTGADGSKVPHLSFRTPEQGCVQYKPANLAIVTEQNNNSLRQLAQEAQDTNTCRSESPEADADSNGLPDNTQPLYMARNGNTAITHTLPNGTTFTEDSRHLYLFRSTRAAEAQLGKTDYAKHNPVLSPPATIPPTDTTDYRQEWSLIATTNPATPLVFAPSTYVFPYSYSVMNGTYKKIDMVSGQPFVVTTVFSSPFFTNCAAYKSPTLATIKQTTQHAQRLTQDWQQTLAVQMGGCI